MNPSDSAGLKILLALIYAGVPSMATAFFAWLINHKNEKRQIQTAATLKVAADASDAAAIQARQAAIVAAQTHKLVNGEKTEQLRQVAELSKKIVDLSADKNHEELAIATEVSHLAQKALDAHTAALARGDLVIDAPALSMATRPDGKTPLDWPTPGVRPLFAVALAMVAAAGAGCTRTPPEMQGEAATYMAIAPNYLALLKKSNLDPTVKTMDVRTVQTWYDRLAIELAGDPAYGPPNLQPDDAGIYSAAGLPNPLAAAAAAAK